MLQNSDEDDILLPFACYDVVNALASVFQWNVIILRNQELCIVASVAEIINDLFCDCAVELKFKEADTRHQSGQPGLRRKAAGSPCTRAV